MLSGILVGAAVVGDCDYSSLHAEEADSPKRPRDQTEQMTSHLRRVCSIRLQTCARVRHNVASGRQEGIRIFETKRVLPARRRSSPYRILSRNPLKHELQHSALAIRSNVWQGRYGRQSSFTLRSCSLPYQLRTTSTVYTERLTNRLSPSRDNLKVSCDWRQSPMIGYHWYESGTQVGSQNGQPRVRPT